ncbi:MAG: hypothetical protein NZM26_02345 [Patescibacteria group bacterium]|nr:hypothetical protein [Patescibacteria group bacterium]
MWLSKVNTIKRCLVASLKSTGIKLSSFELIFVLTLTIVLSHYALTLEPYLNGDTIYYYGQLVGLANNGSPSFSGDVAIAVQKRLGIDLMQQGMLIKSFNGLVYDIHFFAYSLLCVPAFKLLTLLKIDDAKAFVLTNAIFIILAITYVFYFSTFKRIVKWFLVLSYLLSTAFFYFRWGHPEIMCTSLLLMSAIALTEEKYFQSTLYAAVASWQNPSIAFHILVIFFKYAYTLIKDDGLSLCKKFNHLVKFSLLSAVSLWPFIWNLSNFGVYNPIVASNFYIIYSNIGLERFISFFFDLNQGMIAGLPFIALLLPVFVLRRLQQVRKANNLINSYDCLLVSMAIVVIPTLAQRNWNAGHVVFARYATWASALLLVWSAEELNAFSLKKLAILVLLCLVIQVKIFKYWRGHNAPFVYPYTKHNEIVKLLWSINPHLYNPVPEIFIERILGYEVDTLDAQPPVTIIAYQENSTFLKIISKYEDINQVSKTICSSGRVLSAIDDRFTSRPKKQRAEHGYFYFTGRLICK